jgi:hypothetical protein
VDSSLSLIIDSFLDNYEWFRAYCDEVEYGDVVNPVDGVSYPGINSQIPIFISSEVIYKVSKAIGKGVIQSTMFLRMTRDGVDVPHQAHTDVSMGDYGAIVYINREKDCKGGTSFIKHKETGLDCNPRNESEQDVWNKDVNNYDAWKIKDMCGMKQNRALIFNTNEMHRAEPPSGFGSDKKTSRLILCSFFTVIK